MDASGDRQVDEKGRVTIPETIRESLRIDPGEEVTVELDDDRIVIRPLISREGLVEQLGGCIDDETRAEGAEPTDPLDLEDDWTEDLPE